MSKDSIENARRNDALQALNTLAGQHMYEQNAFRITCLSAYAPSRQIRDKYNDTSVRLRNHAPVLLEGNEVELLPDEAASLVTAFQILDTPLQRVVHEVFARWDRPDTSDGCPQDLHRLHDAAVQAHSRALELELDANHGAVGLTGDWKRAGELWVAVLHHRGLRVHLERRIHDLDEGDLSSATVDGICTGLASALVTPLQEMLTAEPDRATRAAGYIGSWAFDEGSDARVLNDAADYWDRRIRAGVQRALGSVDAAPATSAADISRIAGSELPVLARIAAMAGRAGTGSVRDLIAEGLRECAVQIANTEPDKIALGRARRILDEAEAFASSAKARESINRDRWMTGALETVGEVRGLIGRVEQLAATGHSAAAEDAVVNDLEAALRRLQTLALGREAVSEMSALLATIENDCALAVNNLAVALADRGSISRAIRLLDRCTTYAKDSSTRRSIRDNRRHLVERQQSSELIDAITQVKSCLDRSLLDNAATTVDSILMPLLRKVENSGLSKAVLADLRAAVGLQLNNVAIAKWKTHGDRAVALRLIEKAIGLTSDPDSLARLRANRDAIVASDPPGRLQVPPLSDLDFLRVDPTVLRPGSLERLRYDTEDLDRLFGDLPSVSDVSAEWPHPSRYLPSDRPARDSLLVAPVLAAAVGVGAIVALIFGLIYDPVLTIAAFFILGGDIVYMLANSPRGSR